jgi:hypothetical protein
VLFVSGAVWLIVVCYIHSIASSILHQVNTFVIVFFAPSSPHTSAMAFPITISKSRFLLNNRALPRPFAPGPGFTLHSQRDVCLLRVSRMGHRRAPSLQFRPQNEKGKEAVPFSRPHKMSSSVTRRF